MSALGPVPAKRARTMAIALGVAAYIALLGWFATQPPAFDSASMRERIAELAQHPAAPIEPMPVLQQAARTELAMQRDPLR